MFSSTFWYYRDFPGRIGTVSGSLGSLKVRVVTSCQVARCVAILQGMDVQISHGPMGHEKRAPWLFRVFIASTTQLYSRDYFINHDKDSW